MARCELTGGNIEHDHFKLTLHILFGHVVLSIRNMGLKIAKVIKKFEFGPFDLGGLFRAA